MTDSRTNPAPTNLAGPGMPAAKPAGSSDSHAGLAGIDPTVASEKWSQEARRHQRTPGAYEWWSFDAINESGTGVAVSLFEGLPFHPGYLASVNRYVHRPMGSPFDVVPKDAQSATYLAAYVAVFEQGKRVAQGLNLYPSDADDDSPDDMTEIRVGPNRITLRQDGSLGLVARVYPYGLRRWQPKLVRSQTLTVSLNFAPTMPGVQHVRPFRGPGLDGATHVWALSCPHAHVTGTVQHLNVSEGVSLSDMHIDCTGYHDHVYGQGGLGQGIRKLQWGYLLGDDWAAIWHHSPLKGKRGKQHGAHDHGEGVVLIQKGTNPIIIDGPTVRADTKHFSRWFMRYPGRITFHGSDTQGNPVEMLLKNGPAVTNSPFYVRTESRGTLSIPGRGTLTGKGYAHTLKLSRLRWPVLSDLVLMAIQDVRADDPLWRQ